MTKSISRTEFEGVTCPLCGLGCDDLRVSLDNGALEVVDAGCDISQRGFQQASCGDPPPPQIDGRGVNLDQAIDRAADILRAASLPLIAGLGTDVSGARAVMALAERAHAVVDHMLSPGLFRNAQVLQDSGWLTASLTEARNRADLVVIVGDRVFKLFPRLLERIIRPKACLLRSDAGNTRELVLIGPWEPSTLPPELVDWRPTIVPVALPVIGHVIACLQALIAERPVQKSAVESVDINTLHNLARRMQQASYSIVAWAAGELDFPHAELTVQGLVDLVRDLNLTTRSAALPLGGAQGDVTMNQVCLWRSGRPLRTAFSRGRPQHDPVMFDYRRLLAQGDADALLWLSSFLPNTPPPDTTVPTIVLGHPGMALVQTPAVYIPIGVPGVDHAGHIYRSDAVVTLPLRQLRQSSSLPAAAEVLQTIVARL